jgi:hypothetical protein
MAVAWTETCWGMARRSKWILHDRRTEIRASRRGLVHDLRGRKFLCCCHPREAGLEAQTGEKQDFEQVSSPQRLAGSLRAVGPGKIRHRRGGLKEVAENSVGMRRRCERDPCPARVGVGERIELEKESRIGCMYSSLLQSRKHSSCLKFMPLSRLVTRCVASLSRAI